MEYLAEEDKKKAQETQISFKGKVSQGREK